MLIQLKEKHIFQNIQTGNVQYIIPWCMEYHQNSWKRQYFWHTICCKKYFASDKNGSVLNNRRWNIYLTTNGTFVLLAQMRYFALTGYITQSVEAISA